MGRTVRRGLISRAGRADMSAMDFMAGLVSLAMRRALPAFLVVLAVGFSGGCASGLRAGDSSIPLRQRGMASYYAEEYHGRATASGERFDMHAMTAAHRTLPFGATVRVKNLDNGRSVTVRINDRGPFVEGRIIDLSYAAARRIDLLDAGLASVEVQVIDVPRSIASAR
jgi:rare lipoprotein A